MLNLEIKRVEKSQRNQGNTSYNPDSGTVIYTDFIKFSGKVKNFWTSIHNFGMSSTDTSIHFHNIERFGIGLEGHFTEQEDTVKVLTFIQLQGNHTKEQKFTGDVDYVVFAEIET